MNHRNKLFAAAIALVVATAGASLLLGGATAGTWHTYEGDVHPGHAYGLHVPAAAESFEIVFAGDAGSARLAVFDPSGLKVGTYALSPEMATAAFAKPAEGRHVLYVYEVTGGALQVRVNAEDAPALALEQIPLAREDVEVAESAGGALSKTMTITLRQAPVFLTLLYEGSVQDLDATISSEKGPAVTILDETGTAFSPGVWSSLSGQRTSDAANLGGTVYEISLSAAAFEGRMSLASLSLDLTAPAKPLPKTPHVGATTPVASPVLSDASFLAERGDAIEFVATAGKLLLTDAPAPADEEAASAANDTAGDDNATEDEHRHDAPERAPRGGLVASLYAPDDALLAHVEGWGENRTVELELPADGAYVLYVHRAPEHGVMATLSAGPATSVRALPLAEEVMEVYTDGGSDAALRLARAPVALTMSYTDDTLGVLSWASLENEKGTVADLNALARTPFVTIDEGWSQTYPENFAAGEHVLRTSSLSPVGVRIVALSYVRDAVEAAPEPAETPAEEPTGEEPAEEEPAPEEGESTKDQGLFGIPLPDFLPW